MADFNNKFLEDHELIREATRLGITTDELKAQKAASNFEPVRTEIPPDGMSDFYQKILSSSQPKPEPIYSPLLKNISMNEPTEEPTRVPQSVPSPVIRNMPSKEVEQKQQFVNSSIDLNKLMNDPEMADALERQKSDMLMATLGRSASNLGHALAQVKPQADYFSGAEKLAKADVEALKEVRKSGYDKFKQGAEIKKITDMEDGNSELSKQLRNTTRTLLRTSGYKELADSIPENATASLLEQMFPQFAGIIKSQRDKEESELRRQEIARSRDERLSLKEEDQKERNIQKLSDKIAPAQDMYLALRNVETALGHSLDDINIEKDSLKVGNKKLDLPGTSVPLVGRVGFYSGDARSLENTIAKVFNVELKDRSGAAITSNELERLKDEFGRGKFNNETEMIRALKEYKRAAAEAIKNREAAFKPEVLKEYKNRGGMTSEVFNEKETTKEKKNNQTSEKPKKIIQNGHTYTLNPETGEYE